MEAEPGSHFFDGQIVIIIMIDQIVKIIIIIMINQIIMEDQNHQD